MNIDTNLLKTYIPLQDDLWKGILVHFRNNELMDIQFQSRTNLAEKDIKALASDLLNKNGISFKLQAFKSFSQSGYSMVWHKKSQLVSFNIVPGEKLKSTLSIKRSNHDSLSPQNSLSPKALIALKGILGRELFDFASFQAIGRSNSQP